MKAAQTPTTDAAWMALLDTEPNRAMEALVGRDTALICHEASKYLENPDDVKDCVNETFAEVYAHRASFDPKKGALATWIGTIARNKAISAYRKAAKEPARVDADAIPDSGDSLAETEQAADVEQAVAQLSETDRQIIRMKYYEGLSIAEIAESLHIPYETVKKRHTRSLKKLRKSLFLTLALTALLILAACGVIQALRHFGVLPGYGLTAEADPICFLLTEPVEEDTDLYHIAVKNARLYNGKLEMDYDFFVPRQDFEIKYLDETRPELGVEPPLAFTAELSYPDGTPLPGQFTHGISVGDFFFGGGSNEAVWSGKELEALREHEELEFVLHVRNIVFDKKPYCEDVSIPFRMKKVGMEMIADYPHVYDEETGGIVLDPVLEGETLSLNIYPMNGSTFEYSLGLNRDFYGGVFNERDTAPVTIFDENGQVYFGQFPDIQAQDGLIEPFHMDTMAYYLIDRAEFSTFLFEGVKPGKYTLKLPYVYLLNFDTDLGFLRWNLEDCTFSDDVVKIPYGRIYTTSIAPCEPYLEAHKEYFDYYWEVRTRCELERDDMTVAETAYALEGTEPERTLASKLHQLIWGIDADEGMTAVFTSTPGRLDAETGEIVYQIYCTEEYRAIHDLSHLKCSPASVLGRRPMCYRWDRPLEIEFEVK